jgi:hypothetical protein
VLEWWGNIRLRSVGFNATADKAMPAARAQAEMACATDIEKRLRGI